MKRRLWNRRTFVATSVAGGLGVATIGPWGFNFLMDRVDEIGREIPAAPYADPGVMGRQCSHDGLARPRHRPHQLLRCSHSDRPRALPAHRSGFTARITRALRLVQCALAPKSFPTSISCSSRTRTSTISIRRPWARPRGPGGCHGPRHVRPSAPPPLLVGQRASLERDGTCDHASWRGHRSCNRGKALGRTNSPRHLARLHRVGR